MLERTIATRIGLAARQFPVVFLTGPRQSGKTTLARSLFPDFLYLSLEDLQNRDDATTDPRGFLRRLEGAPGAVLDEVQRTPDLFSYLQGAVDERRLGPVILTGSQHFLLSEKISQSLAGRAAIFELLPLSLAELSGRPAARADALGGGAAVSPAPPGRSLDDLLFSGMFPRIHADGVDASLWLDGYLRTYVERDVRSIAQVADLGTFTRFLALCAGRSGQLLNTTALGSDAGVSHTTVSRWLSILEESYVVHLLRPHHQNFSKRMVKAPKLYFTDTGLLCHLLGIRQARDLHAHPLKGHIFETFAVSELRKRFLHHGERPALFFWRDHQGHEVDVLVDLGARRVPIEIKLGQTVSADMFAGLDRYLALAGEKGGVLFHGGADSYQRGRHLVLPWHALS